MNGPLEPDAKQQSELDRLVDGELNDAERRELLQSFDAQPSGWRRCALAFLEAQSWGQDFKSLAREKPIERIVPRPDTGSESSLLRTFWALAACVVAAFTLGAVLQGMWFDAPAPANQPSAFSERSPFGDNVRLVVDDAGGQSPRTLDVPLVDEGALPGAAAEGWSIPANFVQQLEHSGHQVDRQRRYAPVELRDGRQMVVPVDDLQITPVGRRVY